MGILGVKKKYNTWILKIHGERFNINDDRLMDINPIWRRGGKFFTWIEAHKSVGQQQRSN